jgi:cell division protein ZapE
MDATDTVATDTIGRSYSGPLEWYWHFSQRSDFEADPAQLRVLEKLEQLHDELVEYKAYRANAFARLLTQLGAGRRPPRGVYIWGTVGRGKSLLMDAFFSVSPLIRKRRVHFHDFMRWVHEEMRRISGKEDPLEVISTQVAKKLRLLCFDEFHVSDIADAMILGRLLDQLTQKGVVIVLTSNYRPDDLYPNGLQRERFLPAIELIRERFEIVEIEGRTDHRRRVLEGMNVYHMPSGPEADARLDTAFDELSRTMRQGPGEIIVNDHAFRYRRRDKGIIWFDFGELCEKPRSQLDFLRIAADYHTLLVSGLKVLNLRVDAGPVRRLTWLVDICYDAKVKMIATADVEPEWLVKAEGDAVAGALKHGGGSDLNRVAAAEFARTASRLREMQSQDYFSRPHAPGQGL